MPTMHTTTAETSALDEAKAHLMRTSESYRELMKQHREYDRLLAEMEAQPALSADGELEEHRLKKLKLLVKDRMEQMVSEYSPQRAGAAG